MKQTILKSKDFIITGCSALFNWDLANFNTTYLNIAVSDIFFNEKISLAEMNHYKKLNITFYPEHILKIGSTILNGENIYSPERLFVELNTFPLENTVKAHTLRKLLKVIEPSKVKKIYFELKDCVLGLDKQMIEKFLNSKC